MPNANPDSEQKTWISLAKDLQTTRKSLQRWRSQFAGECPPGCDLKEWQSFMRQKGLGPHSLKQNAPIPAADPGESDERALRIRERKLLVEKAEFRLAVEKRETLPLVEYQAALRVTIGAFDSSLKQVPGRVAAKIIQQCRAAFLAAFHAELTEKQFIKLKAALENAEIEEAGIVQLLDDELEAVRAHLAQADFLEPDPGLE